MYINFKSKYKKILWLLIGFLLACSFIDKVNARPTFNGIQENYDFNNFSFTNNNHTYTKQVIFEHLDTILSSKNKTLEDYSYIFISSPRTVSTYYYEMQITLSNLAPDSFFANNSNIQINFDYSRAQLFIIKINLNTNTSSFVFDGLDYNTGLGSLNGNFNIYSNYYFDFSQNLSSDGGSITNNFYYDTNILNSLPDYLNGYKKITLTTDDKYYMLSGLTTGSVFIPLEYFNSSGGRLSYYDNDLSSQPYTSYIQDYTITGDGLYARQDFNLNNYYGADWVMFSKYIYLEGEDNITYDIWVPNDITYSDVTITPNSSGGNDFEFQYKDTNGDIQNQTTSSIDLTPPQPLLSDVFNNFTTNYYGLSSIILSPISFLESVNNATCSSITIPSPIGSSSFSLPCMTPLYQTWFGDFFTLYQTIITGFIAYYVGLGYFNLIKGLKDPCDDRIEVIHL